MFCAGSKIYAQPTQTTNTNTYKTSMAAPNTAGVAALIRSYYQN
jgi:subtilase family serine protease